MTIRSLFFFNSWANRQVSFKSLMLISGTMLFSGALFSDATMANDEASHTSTDNAKFEQIVAMGESAELTETLLSAVTRLGEDYEPRTEHINTDGSARYTNRLILEDSPYLIQHAHNPVNWYPWGKEAFARAKAENKPIFMSIGYATCHWCHVMERESFENEDIAAVLNDNYIAVKVDREQRPDVDSTYMTAVQMIAGRGGWPMSSFLMPDTKPFYGGTYYPPDAFKELLERVAYVWVTQPDSLTEQAVKLSDAVSRTNQLRGDAVEISTEVLDTAVTTLLGNHDDLQGGFSDAPKFPQEPSHFLLLERARQALDEEALQASHFTLTQMARGGIHDQVAGGFHRYSVDNEWLVPHFEKMLYNQAALARLYHEAYELTSSAEHLRTSTRILNYVLREMTSTEGAFFSATDADSEGREGTFFVWSRDELIEALGPEQGELATRLWGATATGNFEHSNILELQDSFVDMSESEAMTPEALVNTLDSINVKLLEIRNRREPPLLDDKIITGWNGMMITAFASVGQALGENKYVDAAIQAAKTVWTLNHREDGRLWRASFAGSSSIEASQTDYAFLAEGLMAIYDATGEALWLDRAVSLVKTMDALFLDPADGTYYMGFEIVGGASMPTRPKDIYDNAVPSGNSVALRVLTRLFHRTGEEKWRDKADRLLATFGGTLTEYPAGFGYLLTAASELIHGETGKVRYAGRGNVKINVSSETPDTLAVSLNVAPGWHINSNQPLQDYLIPTEIQYLDGKALQGVDYPAGEQQVLGFESTALSLYQNELKLNVKLKPTVASEGSAFTARRIALQLQACNDKTCLAPETVVFNVRTAHPVW